MMIINIIYKYLSFSFNIRVYVCIKISQKSPQSTTLRHLFTISKKNHFRILNKKLDRKAVLSLHNFCCGTLHVLIGQTYFDRHLADVIYELMLKQVLIEV